MKHTIEKTLKQRVLKSITFNECLTKEFQQVVTLLKNGHKWAFEKPLKQRVAKFIILTKMTHLTKCYL
jgi:hypothetical protein